MNTAGNPATQEANCPPMSLLVVAAEFVVFDVWPDNSCGAVVPWPFPGNPDAAGFCYGGNDIATWHKKWDKPQGILRTRFS